MDMVHLTFRYRFEAAHRFTKSCETSCATPHDHTWYVSMVLRSRDASLDDADMVVEFSSVKRRFKRFVQETLDHSFLHHVDDPIIPALRKHIEHVRLMPCPGDPTTELLAQLILSKTAAFVEADGLGAYVSVARIELEETPTNRITWDAAHGSPILDVVHGYQGWWNNADPEDRSCVVVTVSSLISRDD